MAKPLAVATSQPVPSQQRGLKRGGTTPPGGSKPQTYKMWLAHLLTSEKHRQAFTATLEDASHPQFLAATKHAAAYAHGMPTQAIEVKDTTPDREMTGEDVRQRLLGSIPILLQTLPGDAMERAKFLAGLKQAEIVMGEP